MEMRRLEGRVALITAAASGIGESICKRFAEEGATVVAASRTGPRADAVAHEVERLGGVATSIAADMADPGAVRDMVESTVDAYGTIDVLVNNAGISHHATGPFWTIDEEAWDKTFAVNVRGMLLAAKYAYPHMPDGSSIINIGSVGSVIAYPDEAPYVSSKGAVLQLTRAMACDCAPRRIRVNCLCPGVTRTPGMESWLGESPNQEALLGQFEGRSLFGRMGEPPEIAAVAAFLASPDASFVTGAAIMADGGWTAGSTSGVHST